jgi:hypothetical protein
MSSSVGTKEKAKSSNGMTELTKIRFEQAPSEAVQLLVRAPIGIRDFGSRGRGVVAIEDLEPGRLVERSPVLIIPSEQRSSVDQTIVFTYVFMWEHHSVEEDLYKHHGRSAIALGYTSLLSHSFEPNCSFVRHIDELFIDVFAKRLIRSGEELTIDYQMTLWFNPIPI